MKLLATKVPFVELKDFRKEYSLAKPRGCSKSVLERASVLGAGGDCERHPSDGG